MGAAVTVGRYRYIEWNGGEEGIELFDHRTDPREITNLAISPEHQHVKKRLQKLLHKHISTDVPTTPFNPKRL